jgi:putative ABC transport system substrate-binding protein
MKILPFDDYVLLPKPPTERLGCRPATKHVNNGRRKLLVALSASALAAPISNFAQPQPARIPRIGVLAVTSATDFTSRMERLQAGLRDFGWIEGENIVIEYRWAEGKYDRLPALAAELARLDVDIIVAHGWQAALWAKRATTTIPIVMMNATEPVATGLVASLARPGGNVTGQAIFSAELCAKRLEFLKNAIPGVTKAAVWFGVDSSDPIVVLTLAAAERAAKSLKVSLQPFYAVAPNKYEGVFNSMSHQRVDAVVVQEEPSLTDNRRVIAELALKQRLPSIGVPLFAEAGGLMGYGVNVIEPWRRVGYFVVSILKDTNPGDLPVEQATTFELVINRKTADAIGRTIPEQLLVRADKVIE